MTTWVLIVWFTGSGFYVPFVTYEACLAAKNEMADTRDEHFSICVEQGANE